MIFLSLYWLITLLLFYVLASWPQGMWDLSSRTRDQILTPCTGRWSLNQGIAKEIPGNYLWMGGNFPLYGRSGFCSSSRACMCSVVPDSLWLLCPWDFPSKNTGVGCHFLLQGIFPIQESNLDLLCLLHWHVGGLFTTEPPGEACSSLPVPINPWRVPQLHPRGSLGWLFFPSFC